MLRNAMKSCALGAMLALLALQGAQAADGGSGSSDTPSEAVRDLKLQGGGSQRVLYARPASVRGTIVMLPGGRGDVGIEEDGDLQNGKNFVVRTRKMWLDHGYAVVIPDA